MNGTGIMAAVLCAGTCLASSARLGAETPRPPRHFTVLSWNTQHYGWWDLKPEKRALLESNMFAVVRHADPDVFLQQETYGSFERFRAALPGYRGVLQSACNSVFTKFEVVATNAVWADPLAARPLPMNACSLSLAELDLGGLRVRVSSFAMFWLPLCVHVPEDLSARDLLTWEAQAQPYRFTPRPQAIRMALSALAPALADRDLIPIVMGGDFNSLSHLDWTGRNGSAERHCGRSVVWPVSKAMADAGFTDAWRAVYPDEAADYGVTAPMPGAVGDIPKPRVRIDYVYSAGRGVKPVAAELISGPYHKPFTWRGRDFTAFPSDHAALLVTYETEER